MTPVRITIASVDALSVDADVLVLKFAQAPYGVDRAVLESFSSHGNDLSARLPKPSGFLLIPTQEPLSAGSVLFVGVPPLRQFGYREIREFARKALTSLAGEAPSVRHVAMTIHGPGYGLDEREALQAQAAGLMDAISDRDYPRALERISIAERNPGRAERLTLALREVFPQGTLETGASHAPAAPGAPDRIERLRSVGYDSDGRRHVFVAMPFSKDFDDLFHYGIQGAVNSAGMLCERADLSTFTGDVIDWVKQRIATSDLVIADLSTANPNVYLEVGYAWGCGRRTVLLARKADELRFDVQGQRCLLYNSIKELESLLKHELVHLPE